MLANTLEGPDEGRVLRDKMRFRYSYRQFVTPGEPIRLAQRLRPRREAVEYIHVGRAPRPFWNMDAAAPGKYVDFVDLRRLQVERPRIARPSSSARPGGCG